MGQVWSSFPLIIEKTCYWPSGLEISRLLCSWFEVAREERRSGANKLPTTIFFPKRFPLCSCTTAYNLTATRNQMFLYCCVLLKPQQEHFLSRGRTGRYYFGLSSILCPRMSSSTCTTTHMHRRGVVKERVVAILLLLLTHSCPRMPFCFWDNYCLMSFQSLWSKMTAHIDRFQRTLPCACTDAVVMPTCCINKINDLRFSHFHPADSTDTRLP
jgi:hypothetical protein